MEPDLPVDRSLTYAVIGASRNPQKYGHIVAKHLLQREFRVFLVNPHAEEILGQKVYRTVREIPKKIDVAVMVTQPKMVMQVLPELRSSGISTVWMQPGSDSDAADVYCKLNKMRPIRHKCIMAESDSRDIRF
jgi:hypothetical protein